MEELFNTSCFLLVVMIAKAIVICQSVKYLAQVGLTVAKKWAKFKAGTDE